MRHIQSKDNPLYKQLIRSSQGKKVDGKLLVWLEGIHLSQAWLDAGYTVVLAVFDAERLSQQHELQQLVQRLDERICLSVSPSLMRQLSSVEQGQGVGLVVRPPDTTRVKTITQTCVYLDRIQDP